MVDPSELLTGQFGPYAIKRLLGHGGMACVYLAEHPEHGTLALKVLHQHLVKRPEVLHRFWREMRLADKLDHSRIVRVRDAGVEGDRFYLAMDYIEGLSLFEYEREHGPLKAPEAIRMMKVILEALHHAHEASMVHRDLKPENILLDSHQEPYVSDFGIAKHLEGTKLTQTGMAVGTPYYMAPEQIRNAKDVGPAADVYSAGVLLYEMVTGSVPYNADDPMAVAHHHIHGTPVAPTSLRPEIPKELELVILKAMEKQPSDRFKSARYMKKALDMVEAGEKTGIKIKGPVDFRGQGGGFGTILLVLVVVGIGAFLYLRPAMAAQLQVEASKAMEALLSRVDPAGGSPTAPPSATAAATSGEASDPGKVGGPSASPQNLPELIEGGYWRKARLSAQLSGPAGEVYADRWAQRIRELLDARDFDQGRLAVKEYREAFPRVLWGPFLQGEAALAEGKQVEAARAFSEGFRLSPREQVESFFERYRPSLRELEEEARKVVKDELASVVQMRMQAGAIDEALMLLRQSSRIMETPETHEAIADLYERSGRRSKAKWHRKRATTLRGS